MNEAQLREALEMASAHLGTPEFARRAIEERGRRVWHRRAIGTGVLVLAIVVPAVFLGRDDRSPDTVDMPPTPSQTPMTIDSDPSTQPVWDPFSLPAESQRDSVLPETLAPPESATSIVGSSLPDIVVAWPQEGRDLRLLSSSGEWRSVPGTATAIAGSLNDVVRPSISPDGDRVAMATDAGILVVEATGSEEVIPWPPALEGPFDARPAVLWLPGDAGFVVLHWERPWFVGLDGDARPARFGGKYGGGVMVDPDEGIVRERRWQNNMLVTWDGEDVVTRASTSGYGERFVTRFGLVAYTGAPAQTGNVPHSGPVVLDAATGDVLAYAPIRDRSSVYSDNGHLTTMGFLDRETVLLLVTPMNFSTMSPEDGITHLVAWHWPSGDFQRLASGGSDMRRIAVAPDLL